MTDPEEQKLFHFAPAPEEGIAERREPAVQQAEQPEIDPELAVLFENDSFGG